MEAVTSLRPIGFLDREIAFMEDAALPASLAPHAQPTPASSPSQQALDSAAPPSRRQRVELFSRAILMGALVGLLATAFRFTLECAEKFRVQVVPLLYDWGFGGWLLLLAGVGVLVWSAAELVRRLAPESAGSGIPHIKAVLDHRTVFRSLRLIAVKFTSGLLGIGAGLALGREGPTVQMGAALGIRVFDWWPPKKAAYREAAIIGGGAAGISAAFNSPLAGVTFALEEMQVFASHSAFLAALIASLVADTISRFFLGELPVFQVSLEGRPGISSLPHCLFIGLVMAGLGILYSHSLLGLVAFMKRVGRRGWWVLWGFVCLALSLVLWIDPRVAGGGFAMTEAMFEGSIGWQVLSIVLVVRFVLSLASYGLATAGGIFAPMLLLGGLAGMILGQLAQQWQVPYAPEPLVWSLVAMAAFFSAVVRCPLTAIVLLVEMTGIYTLVLPLMCGAFMAAFTASLLGPPPIYDELLRRNYPSPAQGGSMQEELAEKVPAN